MKQNIFFSCIINVMCLHKIISTLYLDSVSSSMFYVNMEIDPTRSVVKIKYQDNFCMVHLLVESKITFDCCPLQISNVIRYQYPCSTGVRDLLRKIWRFFLFALQFIVMLKDFIPFPYGINLVSV
ncbi:hypothetical protein VIGAN_01281100 [Vigna angularis var. angularis]|uniref:Uncharacterized protein n=1 Tax=Vigna angularis var. angularis TaxID=157739 RepID=A0A0S3R371_PHAAN|nr:hypothetical protein VIGAN_01281100 [Vigna angularis var. angularis]